MAYFRTLCGLSCVFILLKSVLSSTELEVKKPGLVWKNPHVPKVVPGTKEWARLEGLSEKLIVSDMPKSETSRLGPKELVAALFGYPMLPVIGAQTDVRTAFDMLHGNSNVFKELLSRQEAGEIITAWLEDNYTDQSNMGPIFVFYGLLRDQRFLRLFNDDCLSRICNVCLMQIREAKRLTSQIDAADGGRCLAIVTILHQRKLVLAHGKRKLTEADLPIDWAEHEREGVYLGKKGLEAIVSYACGLK